MENSEVIGFQFEPTNALQPDSISGKSWETCSSADCRALLGEKEHQLILGVCVSTVVKSTTKYLCYHELNACEYFNFANFY